MERFEDRQSVLVVDLSERTHDVLFEGLEALGDDLFEEGGELLLECVGWMGVEELRDSSLDIFAVFLLDTPKLGLEFIALALEEVFEGGFGFVEFGEEL